MLQDSESNSLEVGCDADKIKIFRDYRLLSVDGGGVKGLIVSYCLDHMERNMNVRIPDLFNCYSGTSIGAIIICCFAYLNWSAGEILEYLHRENFMEKFLPKSIWDRILGIFQWKPKYSDSQRLEVLTKLFGTMTMDETDKMVLVTGYDLVRERTIYFTSYGSGKKVKIVDALMVSSSAPLYFPSVHIDNFYSNFPKKHWICENVGCCEDKSEKTDDHGFEAGLWGVDGGLTCNNPSDVALLDLLSYSPATVRVVSVGTGYVQTRVDASDSSLWGIWKWLFYGRLLEKIVEGSGHISEKRCVSLLNFYYRVHLGQSDANSRDYYLRIDDKISESANSVDNTLKSNLRELQGYGERWGLQYYDRFVKLVGIDKKMLSLVI